QIDLMHWLCGTPRRVRGFCQFGRYHDIEVEDNVTVFFEFDSGATGLFVTSTGEAPGTNRFEIAGTRGRVVLENGRLCFTRNESDMRTFSKASSSGFAKPEVWNIDIPSDNASNQHAAVVQNFVEAILDGAALLAPGSDGLRSVEFANAALYSTWTDQTVTLPLDGALYEAALQEKIANSTHQKRVAAPSMATDFAQSFIR
ncbi:MAG: Gfo/Idh/MocA family oxidoreductase, partial [Verrucomicrobia bacterium]|nr:Gfo/Idh/MocA family oxidoreductase [Verrucomicrobiota bacterium]